MSQRARDVVAKLEGVLPFVFDSMIEGVQIVDRDWRYVYVNAAAAGQGRAAPADLLGRTMMEAYPGIETTDMFGLLERCMTERTPRQAINRFAHPDGHEGWFDLRITPVPQGILILSVDISAQKAAEEDLRRSREDLATTLNCMAEGVVTTDVDGRVTGMNPAAEALTGWSEGDALGRRLGELVSFAAQKTGAVTEGPVARVLSEGTAAAFAKDTVLVDRHGRRTPIATSGAPIQRADGETRGVVLAFKDMREEYELSSMLQQSQKMEAVGRLAGGVAHDFNNVLTVITGCVEILLEEIPEGDPLREDAGEILKASERAAALTRQLLAFSRRQASEPERLDVGEVLSGMENMLRRLIGEDVDLAVTVAPGPHPVRFDASRLEQAVMNLAVNARDAMPHGGSLTIEVSDVELTEEYARLHLDAQAGPHVRVAVTDTGQGMEATTRERVFEPFFTTKARGIGTGLGLSTLYGTVKQAGGNVWVYSEPGRGTTFKVYLPRLVESRSARPAPPRAAAEPTTGHETVLVVEDEPAVRRLIRTTLERGGYRVLEAADSDEALRLCESDAAGIDLLLTDVVLRETGGPDLAAAMLALCPDLRVAYMSGYTDVALTRQGVVEARTAFIEKPVAPSTLLQHVRTALSPGGGAPTPDRLG